MGKSKRRKSPVQLIQQPLVEKSAALLPPDLDPCDIAVNPKTNRATRVRFVTERDASGKVTAKRRVALEGTVLGDLTRPEGEAHGVGGAEGEPAAES